jgi:drug/metabolite transporter (DMT)-like permease
VFAAVFATFFLGEKLGWFKSAGIALTMVGLTLLTQLDLGSIATFGRYELMALASALMAAAVVIVIRQLTRTESSATIFASQCLYGLLLAVPFACMHQQTLNMIDLAFLIGAALCASIGQLAMTEGFRFLTVTMGAGSQMLIPVIISLASIGLFHESFTWLQALGGVLVLWGMFQTVVGRRR